MTNKFLERMTTMFQKHKFPMFLVFFLAMLAWAYTTVNPANAVDGYSLMKKSFLAEKSLSYQGIQVSIIDLGKGLENHTVKVFHAAPNKTRFEYFSSKRSDGRINRVVIDNGTKFWDYQIDKKQVIEKVSQEIGKEKDINKQLSLLKKNYVVSIVGSEKIAGRGCIILTVSPKGSSSMAKKIWLDKQNNLILKIETYHIKGNLNSIFYFKTIQYVKSIPSNKFNFTPSAGIKVVANGKRSNSLSLKEVENKVRFPLFIPTYMPREYIFDNVVINKYKGNNTVHLRYTDGVSAVSLFQSAKSINIVKKKEKYKEVKVNKKKFYFGQEAGIKVLVWETDRLHFLLLGNLAESTMLKIANSLERI